MMTRRISSSDELSAEDVIDILRHAGRQLETAPGVVESQGEEGLRSILLTAVNGATRGLAVAEAFNNRGKTDILVRREGVNLYLAECKNYAGPKKLGEAIDQLLRYTGWREREVGLLVFVRSTTMTTAIKAARQALSEEESVRSVQDLDDDGSDLLAIAAHPADPALDLEITIQLFNLPLPRDRKELIGGELSDQPQGLEEVLAGRGVPAPEDGIAYQTHEGPQKTKLPIRPDALVRIERITPEGRVAIDAIPMDEKAADKHAPAGQIEFSDPEGARQLRRALRDHVAVELPGARLRFDRLPPLFHKAAEELEELAAANPEQVTVRLAPQGLWQCKMHVETNRGNLEVPMAFASLETKRKDELAVRGSFHDVALTLRVVRGHDPTLEWSHQSTDSPIRERLASLDFLYALSGEGEIRWESIDPPSGGVLSVTTEQEDLPENLVFDRTFFGNLVLLEDYLDLGFELPDEIDEEGVAAIFTAAEAVRTGKATVLVNDLTLKAPAGELTPGDETELHGPVPVDIAILGTKFRLGLGQGTFQAQVSGVEHHGDIDHVTFVPQDEKAAKVEVSDIQPMLEDRESQKSGSDGTRTRDLRRDRPAL
jgi:hypothetical protein